jgi:four helix bundle protein
MEITTFTDLIVWRRAMDLVVDVYRVSDTFPRNELFVLTGQTRKSSISIPSNIAEGFCRHSLPAYINHVNIALGSEGELFTQLELARRLGFADSKTLEQPFQNLAEVGRMMTGLVKALELKLESQKSHKQTTRRWSLGPIP